MKYYIQILILLVVVLAVAAAKADAAPAENQKRLAVLSIENSAHLFPNFVQSLPTMLVTELVQKTGEQLVERSKIEEAMKELGLESNGVTADGSMKIGQWVGADRVLLGNFNQIGPAYRLDLRVIEVSTGRIIAASQASVREDLLSLVTQAVANLAPSLAARKASGEDESGVSIHQTMMRPAPQTFSGKGRLTIRHRITLSLLTEKPVPYQIVRIYIDGKLAGSSSILNAVNEDYVLFSGDVASGPHVVTLEHCVVNKSGVWKRNLEVQPSPMEVSVDTQEELDVSYRMRVGSVKFDFDRYQVN